MGAFSAVYEKGLFPGRGHGGGGAGSGKAPFTTSSSASRGTSPEQSGASIKSRVATAPLAGRACHVTPGQSTAGPQRPHLPPRPLPEVAPPRPLRPAPPRQVGGHWRGCCCCCWRERSLARSLRSSGRRSALHVCTRPLWVRRRLFRGKARERRDACQPEGALALLGAADAAIVGDAPGGAVQNPRAAD